MPPNPLILAFDTSAAHVAAAVLSGDQIVAEYFAEMGRGQDQQLFPVLEDVLTQAGVTFHDLDGIGVGIGPGNFTGVRISVAAAKGLALALDIPAIGVNGFEALKFDLVGAVYAAVAAPRGGAYLDAGNGYASKLVPSPNDVEALHNPKANPVLVGDVDRDWADALNAQPISPKVMCAAAIAHVAARRLQSSKPILPPKPIYIKPADAAPGKTAPPKIIA